VQWPRSSPGPSGRSTQPVRLQHLSRWRNRIGTARRRRSREQPDPRRRFPTAWQHRRQPAVVRLQFSGASRASHAVTDRCCQQVQHLMPPTMRSMPGLTRTRNRTFRTEAATAGCRRCCPPFGGSAGAGRAGSSAASPTGCTRRRITPPRRCCKRRAASASSRKAAGAAAGHCTITPRG